MMTCVRLINKLQNEEYYQEYYDSKPMDNEMMIYFIKKNFKLLITTKNEKDIPGSITKQNNNYQFLKTGGSNSSTSDEINKKDILSIKIVRD